MLLNFPTHSVDLPYAGPSSTPSNHYPSLNSFIGIIIAFVFQTFQPWAVEKTYLPTVEWAWARTDIAQYDACMANMSIDRGKILIDLLLGSHRVAKTLALSTKLPLDELYCLTLIHTERPACVKVLSKLLGVRGPRTSKLLGSLEHKGYLRRTMNAIDHRMEMIALTDEGTDAAHRLIREAEDLIDNLMEGGEVDQLRHLVGRLEQMRMRAAHQCHSGDVPGGPSSAWLLAPDEE